MEAKQKLELVKEIVKNWTSEEGSLGDYSSMREVGMIVDPVAVKLATVRVIAKDAGIAFPELLALVRSVAEATLDSEE